VRLADSTTFSHKVRNYPGMPSRPFTCNDASAKFDQLTAGRVDG